MANSHNDWRVSLTASERYDNIQRLTKSIAAAGLSQSAFSLENEAYKNCNSRQEYEAAVFLSCGPPESTTQTLTIDDEPPYLPPSIRDDIDDQDDSVDPGIRIGPYQNCHYVASGVTAEVYRSHSKDQDHAQAIALKVIVETHNIEPHDPAREAKMLEIFSKDRPAAQNIIPLLETFRDHEQRFVLVFPYLPLTLGHLLEKGPHPLSNTQIQPIFLGLFRALSYLHAQGIIHRDIKPSAVLLSSSNPTPEEIYLSDFGTAWHPTLSLHPPVEPANQKILDIGTGPYRAPEVLFGNKAYSTAVDMWASGVMFSECCSPNGKPIFESRPVHEDGNQLGLILNIFQAIGSPTREIWPEAEGFRTPPFEMYRFFEGKKWEEILDGVEGRWRSIVERLIRYESSQRASAREMVEEFQGGDLGNSGRKED
ncbi:serine/threonine-protein kinase csk1 [Naviculisporaceae sp. PSN 640]